MILEQLGKGKTFPFTLTGNSMHPLIRKGDRVHIQGCDPRDLSAGDIITYRNDALYVTHRVLWIRRRGTDIRLIAKGDSEITVDPPLSPEHILGKVAAIGRANRTLNLETPSWRFINRCLGLFFLVETASILLYRITMGSFPPVCNMKPSLFYRHLKNRSLRLATRVIM